MASASELDPVSTKQQRIAELAKQMPQKGLTSLAHHIDVRWLYEAYLRTRPDGAVGVDGQTAEDYVGGRPLLLSLVEDGVPLAQPRLVTDGDVKGGRYVSDMVDLHAGSGPAR